MRKRRVGDDSTIFSWSVEGWGATGEVFGKKDQNSPVSRLFLICVFDAQWEY